jgi:hypothetical protein
LVAADSRVFRDRPRRNGKGGDEKVSRNMRTKLGVFGGTALLAATLLAVGAFMADLMADLAHDDLVKRMRYPPT